MRALHHLSAALALPALALLLAAGCSSGSGASSSKSTPDFAIEAINVLQGQEWKINRPIDVTFNQAVDFSSVNHATISITDPLGNVATGIFSQPRNPAGQIEKNKVRFQPNCPTLDDNSDAGLLPNTSYRLTIYGSANSSTTVRSEGGDPLEQGTLVNFKTPNSENSLDLFIDSVPGPPAIRLRGVSGVPLDDVNATHIELGGEKVYFAINLVEQQGQLPAGFLVPLNHYSIPENQVSVILQFNQPVSPASSNINASLLAFEYDAGGSDWQPMQTTVELIENCTATGAAVRISPLGILPQDSELRIRMGLGFRDITGDQTTANITNFARMEAAAAGDPNPLFPEIGNPKVDELLEQFTVGGNDIESLEDTQAAFATPRADWGGGTLQSSFDFNGTGGPNGDFDWVVPAGTEIILDTISDTIVGGPDGVPSTTQAVINGVVDVNDLIIPASSRVIIQGPNPCTILATGDVIIEGEISVRGSDSQGVGTLNTTNQPEAGAKGQAGGGDGGTGSYLTTQSTPRGGRGNGPFNTPNGGGQGGETSYSNAGKNQRRGAGGGGGRLGVDIFYLWEGESARCQTLVGLDAEYGGPGGIEGLGAESQSQRAMGGGIGPDPFLDSDDDNNFFGVKLTSADEIVFGELSGLIGGPGGGAGGDAVNSDSFPLTPFSPSGDEKGAGGGGGAGGIRILAIGRIVVGDEQTGEPGSIAAEGGDGGGGENTNFFDRVGGGSGGGAGGHIVLSSATNITIVGVAGSADDWYTDDPAQVFHTARPLSAVGGQGGAGNQSKGGANENGPSSWRCDGIPLDFFVANNQPPRQDNCFQAHPNFNDPDGLGPVHGLGGDGSPGIIQLHVENPATDIILPDVPGWDPNSNSYLDGVDVTYISAPPPLGWKEPGVAPDVLVPFFGRKSMAQSRWIPLGLARLDPGGGTNQVLLRFEGTDEDGTVEQDGTVVDQLPPIVGPDLLGTVGNPPYITDAGFTMVVDADELAGDDVVYAENPALLRNFSVRLGDTGDPNNTRFFTIATAEYDDANGWLLCHIDAAQDTLTSFVAVGDVEVSVVPHFVRVLTDGILDAYPADTAVTVLFDATTLDTLTGLPSDADSYSETNGMLTPDVDDLNADDWDFIRFQVEFDLNTSGGSVNLETPRPGIDILRFSFRF